MKKYAIVGLLLLLVLGLFLTGCAKKQVQQTEPVVAQEEVVSAVPEPVLEEASVSPEEVDKCGLETVIAFTGCEKVANGNIKINVINTGKASINGLWYYIQSMDGTYGYEKLDKTFAVKEIQGYEVDINKWTEKLGQIKQVIIKPIFEGKACNNQKKTAIVAQCK